MIRNIRTDNDDYFNYFKSQLRKGRYLSDQEKCNELLSEFERKNK